MLQDVTRLRANNKLKSYAAFFKIKVNSPDILGNLPSDNETKGSFSSKTAEVRQKHKVLTSKLERGQPQGHQREFRRATLAPQTCGSEKECWEDISSHRPVGG